MSFPQVTLPLLATTTIVPDPVQNPSNFIQYLTRLYEDIAFAVNAKDFVFFQIAISDVATDIPNVANFGAYIVCVSGVISSQPVKTWSLVKSDSGVAGVINILGTQAGTGVWAAINLTITSTATNFQIAHNLAGVTANFNIRIIGTQ